MLLNPGMTKLKNSNFIVVPAMATKKIKTKPNLLLTIIMSDKAIRLNEEVTKLLDDLNHPLKREIAQLRQNILSANKGRSENINGTVPIIVIMEKTG